MYDRIKSLCTAKGITISKLESECGFGNGTINHWRKSVPKADALYAVSKALDSTMEYILTGNAGAPDDTLSEEKKELISLIKEKSPDDVFVLTATAKAQEAVKRSK